MLLNILPGVCDRQRGPDSILVIVSPLKALTKGREKTLLEELCVVKIPCINCNVLPLQMVVMC